MDCVLIGYGYWGQIVEKYIIESKRFNLLGICDPLKNETMNLDDVLNNIDCAFVCIPTQEHYATVEKLLQNKVHVFCEKPLCKNLRNTKYLTDLAHEKECILFTDYIYMVSPSIQYMKQCLHTLGRILYIDMSIKQFGRFYKNEHVFETIGVHMLSVLLYLFDNQTLEVMHIDKIVCNSEGYVESGIVYYEIAGIRGKIESDLLAEKKERTIKISCENGLIIFDMLADNTIKVIAHKDENGQKKQTVISQKALDENNNLKHMVDLFADIIDGKKDHMQNTRITLGVAEALEDIYIKAE